MRTLLIIIITLPLVWTTVRKDVKAKSPCAYVVRAFASCVCSKLLYTNECFPTCLCVYIWIYMCFCVCTYLWGSFPFLVSAMHSSLLSFILLITVPMAYHALNL